MQARTKYFILWGIFFSLPCCTFSQQNWDSLGRRIERVGNHGPEVMYADSNYLYMAGEFKTIDGMHIQGIGRWDGVKWDSIGSGIGGLVYDSMLYQYPGNTNAITPYQNKLYVGGWFPSVGKVKAPCMGTWNGTTWDSLPIQPFTSTNTAVVIAMTVINNKLYVGGEFDTVAGFPCTGIACWNGTNWNTLNFPNYYYGNLFRGIGAICEYQGSIYVGGTFYDSIPSDSTAQILRYDSTGWHSVGSGIKGNADDIWSMVVYNGELYVAGEFLKSEGNIGNNIQRWNGTSWSDVGGGTDLQIESLMVYNGKLYAMGIFSIAGGVPANRIAEWDGTKWCGLGSTFDNTINASCIYKDSLYIGGGFWTINGDSIIYVAKWTGGNYVDTCGNDATGISQVMLNNERLNVYPNPSNGQFTFDFNTPVTGTIEIYDITGQKVYQETVQSEKTEINLSGQSAGMYFYRVLTSSGSLIGEGKVVKE